MKNSRYRKSLAICTGLALMVPAMLLAQEVNVQRNPIVVQATAHTTTPLAFRDMTPVPWHNLSKVMPEHDRAPHRHISNVPDELTQIEVLPPVSTTNLLNFDGINDAQGGGFVPPDTNASVGATQVVETVNVAYSVYDKTTSSQIMAPTNIQTLYTPLGGQCATGNLSDPIVSYDKMAGRWLITMIAFNNTFSVNDACVAVSTSSDATGSYHLYQFSYGKTLPDYPKVGIWPDAYYLTTDSFPNGGAFTGAESCALDRTNMLAGNTAAMVCFQRNTNDFALLPADLDGATAPPAGSPNYQMDLASSTKLNLYQFHVDFVKTSNSTFTGPTTLTVKSYTDACAATGTCITQPTGGELLDALGDRLMYRLPYRNFGGHEALVATHSVKPGGTGKAVSGVRWYEIRSPKTSPVVFQSGTVGGGTSSVALWMGSIAMDKVGDIALGYSESGKTMKPSIAYVGRIPTDALGKMEAASTIVTGGGVQQSSSNRWGDYSSMAIDPADDCTFWYAQEYYKTTGSFNFSTRLASFKFTTCH
jgi:hypothetical protein